MTIFLRTIGYFFLSFSGNLILNRILKYQCFHKQVVKILKKRAPSRYATFGRGDFRSECNDLELDELKRNSNVISV